MADKFSFSRDDNETFRLELLIKDPVELGMIQALQKDPNDEVTRKAYVDYLKEHDREISADIISKGHVPGGHVYKQSFISGMVTSPFRVGSGAVFLGTIGSGQAIVNG